MRGLRITGAASCSGKGFENDRWISRAAVSTSKNDRRPARWPGLQTMNTAARTGEGLVHAIRPWTREDLKSHNTAPRTDRRGLRKCARRVGQDLKKMAILPGHSGQDFKDRYTAPRWARTSRLPRRLARTS